MPPLYSSVLYRDLTGFRSAALHLRLIDCQVDEGVGGCFDPAVVALPFQSKCNYSEYELS